MAETYKPSGKFNPIKTLLAFVLAIALAVLSGIAYAYLCKLSSFIILDLLIFALTILLGISCGILLIVRMGHVRNKWIKYGLGLIVCLVGWYTSWAFVINNYHFWNKLVDVGATLQKVRFYLDSYSFGISKFTSSSKIEVSGMGMWALAALELAFCIGLPMAFTVSFSRDEYCENCNRFNKEKDFYLHDIPAENTLSEINQRGDCTEMRGYPRWEKLPANGHGIDLNTDVYKVEMSYCENCKRNGILTIHKGKLEKEKKKDTLKYVKKERLANNILITDLSVAAIVG